VDRLKPEAQVPGVPDVSAERFQAHRMEAIGELASGLAHELNNSLASITAFSQLVRLDARLPAELRRDAELLVEEANRVRNLVGALLELIRSRPKERHPTSLAVLVASVLDLQSYHIAAEQIVLQVAVDRDLPRVSMDRQAMQLVLLDLTSRASNVLTIQATIDGPLVRLSVSHDGVVSPDLAVAQSIVAAHGGQLQRVRGRGSAGAAAAYVLELPLLATTDITETAVGAAGPPRSDHPVRVLVVDDEPSIRRFLSKALELAGYEPVIASHGEQAVDLVTAADFDAVLCDYKMVGLTGREVYEAIVAARPALVGRFVFMSGDTLNPELADFAEARGIRLLAKPFDLASVGRTVREIMAAQPRG
jgi:two-component system NtrC family sensor kinase